MRYKSYRKTRPFGHTVLFETASENDTGDAGPSENDAQPALAHEVGPNRAALLCGGRRELDHGRNAAVHGLVEFRGTVRRQKDQARVALDLLQHCAQQPVRATRKVPRPEQSLALVEEKHRVRHLRLPEQAAPIRARKARGTRHTGFPHTQSPTHSVFK